MRSIKRFVREPVWVGSLAAPLLLGGAGALEPPPAVRFGDVAVGTGIRVRYATSGDSLGAPVIFLHGTSDSWFSFSTVLARLSPGLRAFALDQRGHGGSERPDTGYAMRDFAADVVAFMDAMKLPRATVVGHSMGSLIAREVALLAPERVTRLVLIGAPATGDNAAVRELAGALRTMQDSVPGDFVREFQASTVHEPLAPEFLAAVVRESSRVPLRVWQEAVAGMMQTADPAALRHLRIPTLLVWGAKDAYFPRKEQDRLVKALPNARLVVYEGSGHAPHWERPEQFVRDLEAFLRK